MWCVRTLTDWCWIFMVFVILNMVGYGGGVPAKRPEFVEDSVQHYLMRFGYLPMSDLETGNLRSESQLNEAVRTLQRWGGVPETGRIDAETERLLAKPRCGLPDEVDKSRRKKRYTLQGKTWPHLDLSWSLSSSTPPGLDRNVVRFELQRALDVWARHSKLTFKERHPDAGADIEVSFFKGYHGDGYAFDGRGQILAHAFFPGTGRGGDAHFDEEEIWLTGHVNEEMEGTSLFMVAAHEFGHSLGLSHSSTPGSLMYPWYQSGVSSSNFQLPDDDKHGIQQMYGADQQQWADIPNYYPQQPRHHTTTTTTTTHRPRYTTNHPKHHPNHHPRYPPDHPKYNPRYPPDNPNYKPRYRPEGPRHEPDQPTRQPYPSRPDYPTRQPPTRPEYPYRPEQRPEYPYRPEQRPEYPYRPEQRPEYPNRPEQPNRPEYPRHSGHPGHTPATTTTRRPRKTTSNPRVSEPPDKCDTSYDAIAVIRGEVFIFKDAYLWRIGDNGLYDGYPAMIAQMWNDLPADLTHVDAVYERPDKKIVFFIGQKYYLYNGNDLVSGFPRPISDLGLPESLTQIDGAMVWGHNGKTYLFSGTMYWRLDEDVGTVELDYPRDMSMWKGVGYNIDTVFQWKDGKTYFFKGKGFWKFNDLRMRVVNVQQSLSAPFWMGCPTPNEGVEDHPNALPESGPKIGTASGVQISWILNIVIGVHIIAKVLRITAVDMT